MTKKLGNNLTKKDIKELQKQMPELPKKNYYYECNECFYNWESDEEYNYLMNCPRCGLADLHVEEIEDDK